MKIFLLGFSYSGKTVIGKALSETINYDFIDIDEQIEYNFAPFTIEDIFAKYGEYAFRIIEQQTLLNILKINDNRNTVISLGGGTPCWFNNMAKIKTDSISVYLNCFSIIIVNRFFICRVKRPLLAKVKKENITTYVNLLQQQRSYFYKQADIIYPAICIDIQDLATTILNFKK
ncbi:MAG: shikimate kinase [Bacteroidales bacterium]|jgi:shikimate kinase|nr:shikimate kinase [Bacteroidales bacterium]